MSLVAHWRLEGDASDSLGEYDGYEVGGPSYSSAKLGDGYDNTAGNGTGIELLRHDDFTEYEAQYSFSLWFKSTTTSGHTNPRIIARDASEYPTVIINQSQSGQQDFTLYDIGGSASAQANEWHHIAFTIDVEANESQFFLDGELVGSGGTNKTNAVRPYVIGGNTEGDGDISGDHFEGKIDDVRLYDHVLSKKEVQQLSQAKVLHYKLNDDSAVTDASGQGNDGDLNGPTFTEDSVIGSGAYDFDGTNDTIEINNSSLSPENQSFTYSAWIRGTSQSADYRRVFQQGRAHVHGWAIWAYNDGREIRCIGTDSNENRQFDHSFYAGLDGNWHQIVTAIDRQSNEARHYFDGERVATDGIDSSFTISPSVNPHIGSEQGDIYWTNIDIAETRVYRTDLSDSEVTKLYQQRASIDAGGNAHAHELNEGLQESFESGSFGPRWTIGNATLSTTRSYLGNWSFGSWGDGELDARFDLGDERQIDSFEYVWKEDSSQTGHVVALNDENGNVVQESGTENPQWYLNNGSGGRFQVYGGDNYNEWTRFRFDFDWENGEYDYSMEDLASGTVKTGTGTLEDTTGVHHINFAGGSTLNNYGSADYNRFDAIKINDFGIGHDGVVNSADLTEVGPASESLVGWWPLDGDVADYSLSGNDGTNNGATKTSGLGQGAYSFNGSSNYINKNGESFFNFDSVTVSCWAYYPSGTTDQNCRLVMKGTKWDDPNSYLLWSNNSNTQWRGGDGTNNFRCTGSLSAGWNHFVGTFTDGTARLYEGGVEVSNDSISGSTLSATNLPLVTGANNDLSNHYFNGKIQDVRIYDRALSAEEVAQLYALTDPREDQQMMQSDDGTVLAKEEFTENL